MKLKNYILLFILIAVQSTFAQVQFEARVNKTQLGINERLRVEFSMNQEGDNFNPPSFSGFEILMGPSQSVSHSWINGKRSFSKVYAYVLSPTKKGNITIAPAAIEIDDQVYRTKPIKILVTSAISKPKNPNNPNYIASENIHLVTEVSNSSPYVNEAITLTQKLYVHPSINISDFNTIKDPKLTGFWSQDVSNKQLKVERGEYKGSPFNYVILKRTVLYPQTVGAIKIKPLVLDVAVNVPTKRRDFFGRPLYQSVHQKVSAQLKTIRVKALPETGKPENFTGAVGQFEFDVTTNKTTLKSEESLKAVVQVKGIGNLKLFQLPKLVVPSSLEVYEPEHKENVRTTYAGMQGVIKDTYTVVPQYQGNYPIPELEFSYFDPKAEKYVVLKSITHQVEVLTGAINNTGQLADKKATQVVEQTHQFRSFQTQTKLIPIGKPHFFRTILFWCLLLLPLVLIPIVWVVRKITNKSKNDVRGHKLRKADKLAKKFLSEAKKNLNDKTLFYESLHKALHNYLKAKLQIETSEFSADKIKNIFEENKIASSTANQFIQLIENCNLARFTPISGAEMQQDYKTAVQVINAIDKDL